MPLVHNSYGTGRRFRAYSECCFLYKSSAPRSPSLLSVPPRLRYRAADEVDRSLGYHLPALRAVYESFGRRHPEAGKLNFGLRAWKELLEEGHLLGSKGLALGSPFGATLGKARLCFFFSRMIVVNEVAHRGQVVVPLAVRHEFGGYAVGSREPSSIVAHHDAVHAEQWSRAPSSETPTRFPVTSLGASTGSTSSSSARRSRDLPTACACQPTARHPARRRMAVRAAYKDDNDRLGSLATHQLSSVWLAPCADQLTRLGCATGSGTLGHSVIELE